MFDILFLGTGASVPSKDRALPCVAIRRGSDVVLFDCGEGSQRQLMLSPFSFMKIKAIFVTHLHGDHFYGLPGLLQTMGMMGRRDPLTVCGPSGFSEAIDECLAICEGDLEYDLEARDLSPGDTVRVGDMEVTAFATEHGMASQGYVLREPDARGKIDVEKARALGISGRDFSVIEDGGVVNGVVLDDISHSPKRGLSVAYTGDTTMCQSVKEAVNGVDVLIHESTYMDSESELATAHFHSTAAQAATLAGEAGCGALMLIHISNRYKDPGKVLEEARAVFRNAYAPNDLDRYRVTHSGVRSV